MVDHLLLGGEHMRKISPDFSSPVNVMPNEFTSEELTTFLEGLDQKQFQKIVDFFPKLDMFIKIIWLEKHKFYFFPLTQE